MAKAKLEACTKKVLSEMARKKGIAGWRTKSKEELILALAPVLRKTRSSRLQQPNRLKSRVAKPSKKRILRPQVAAARDTSSSPSGEEQVERSKFEVGVPTKNLSAKVPKDLPAGYGKDRIVAMVRDPYWLHCYWELTRQSVQRAEAALGQEWHGAKPILRLVDVSSRDTTSSAESIVKDIEIHGGCNNWYVDVLNPPRSYRVDIGYLSNRGRFYVLARSNVVSTPRAGVSDVIDENWADFDAKRKFWFQLDAELIVYGATDPKARVTLQGEPVKLRPDGTFTMRFSLPDSRQIIPAAATSADGVEERTIVLAVERNTKHLEATFHECDE